MPATILNTPELQLEFIREHSTTSGGPVRITYERPNTWHASSAAYRSPGGGWTTRIATGESFQQAVQNLYEKTAQAVSMASARTRGRP
jgi:hypothetical protein